MKENTEIINALRVLVQSLRIASRAAEKAVGLSGAQLFVLEKLAEASPLSLNELAERTHTHQSSVSVVVSRLVRKRLISSARDGEDGRKLVLSLTKTGADRLKNAPITAQEKLLAGIDKMKKADRQKLATLLTELIDRSGLGGQTAYLFLEEPKKESKKERRKDSKNKKAPTLAPAKARKSRVKAR